MEQQRLGVAIGLISANLPFIGYDGPCHIIEEVANASTIGPWCMIWTIVINGILGFATVLVFLFCISDVDAALASPTGYDFIEVFFSATNSYAGTSVMTEILIVLVTCASLCFLASASRQVFAFARDGGLPFSEFLDHVNHFWGIGIPVRAVGFSVIIAALIGLINIGSTVAFNAIVSLTIAGLFSSYLVPVVLLIIKRLKREPVEYGPWSLAAAGLATNLFAAGYLMISIFFSFFPPGLPVDALTMNWSVVVFVGANLIGRAYFVVRGRVVYHGPRREHPSGRID